MTAQEQYEAYDEMQLTYSHEREMKLRQMAADAVDGKYDYFGSGETVFPVQGKLVSYDGCEGMKAGTTRYHSIRVRLIPEIAERSARLLIAEQIIRPQLREAGWNV